MNIRTSRVLRARRLLNLIVQGGVLVLGTGLSTVVAVQAQQTQPGDMFRHTSDPRVIGVQVRSALPAAIDGLEGLVNATDNQKMQRAMTSINNTYRYLRAAQESTVLISRRAKYPDPLAPVYANRMWEVRAHMLKCLDISNAITPENPENVAMCADELTQGIRKLRILIAIMP
jgi:hypothetical protein